MGSNEPYNGEIDQYFILFLIFGILFSILAYGLVSLVWRYGFLTRTLVWAYLTLYLIRWYLKAGEEYERDFEVFLRKIPETLGNRGDHL